MSLPQMIDWQKDACGSMWFLSAKLREARGYKLTDDQREQVQQSLKNNVARYKLRMCAENSTMERKNK